MVSRLFLGGSEATEQDQFEEVRNERRANGTAGGCAEGSVDLSGHAWTQFEL